MNTANIDLDQIIESIVPEGSTASGTGLPFNPFPVGGIAPSTEASLSPPLESAVTHAVREFLVSALSTDDSVAMVVTGERGLGKTHLLRWIEHVINSATVRIQDRSVRAFYIGGPGFRPMEVLSAFVRAIGEDDLRKMIWAIVAEDFRTRFRDGGYPAIAEALGAESDERLADLVREESLSSFSTFRQRSAAASIPPRALREYVKEVLTGVTADLDVARTLASMIIDDEMAPLAAWVSVYPMERQRRARTPQQEYLQAILSVMRLNGVGRTFLLVDEFQEVTDLRLSERQQAEYLATLQLLTGGSLSNLSLVVALTPRVWEQTKQLCPPLSERVGDNVVHLQPLDLRRARELIERYVALAYQDANGDVDRVRFPFTEDALTALLQLSHGNTRAFVSACRRVLRQHWQAHEIDADAVRASLAA